MPLSSPFEALKPQLEVYFANRSALIPAAEVFVDYPDRKHFPESFFPILSMICTNHDVNGPTHFVWNIPREETRSKRWVQRYKPAELLSILLAAAQQQAKRVDEDAFRVYRDNNGVVSVQVGVPSRNQHFVLMHVAHPTHTCV